jgi:uncharacterized protein YjdB
MGEKDKRFRNIEASQYSSPSGYDSYFDYQKAIVQEKFDSDFDYASNAFQVEYEYPRASGSYLSLMARVGPVVTPERGVYLGDDYRKLKFKDLDFRPQLGDIFGFGGQYWITYNTENTLSLSSSCITRRINHTMQWEDKYGKIHSEPSVIDYFRFTTSYSAIDADKYMRTGRTTRFILMQDNTDTLTIQRDSRFIFDSLPWLVLNVDRLTHVGILEISVQEDLFTAMDDQTNGIAHSDATPVYDVQILNKPTQLYKTQTFQLNAVVSKESLVVTGEPVTYSSSNTTVATVSSSGLVSAIKAGSVIITVSLNSNTAIHDDAPITIIASSPATHFISGDNTIHASGTYVYTVVNPLGTYVFSLNNSLAEIVSSTAASITIKAKNSSGSFVLSATAVLMTPVPVITLPITIRAVW